MFIMSKFTIKAANADAEAVIEEFLDALEAMDTERLLNVWHDNGVQVTPFAPDGYSNRIEGKTAIHHQYIGLLMRYKSVSFPDRAFHFTNDSNRVWVEFRAKIEIKASGQSYNNTYVCLFTLRDGRIIEYKEYFNPINFLNAFGNHKGSRKKFGQRPKE